MLRSIRLDHEWTLEVRSPIDGWCVAVARNSATGECREQTVAEAKARKVKDTTLLRRFEKHGANATPHTLIG